MSDVKFLTSDLLSRAGVRHGWFMRYGGVSKDLFESLNGKKENGDSDENVEENRQRALQSLVTSEPQLVHRELSHIIHEFKTNILLADSAGEFHGYDASVTKAKGVVLSQTTADCGTIIISDIKGSIVSVVHGSWHTLTENIIRKTVAEVNKHALGELIAGIGPMICKNCYEYGPEAEGLFNPKYLAKLQSKFFVDLKQMIIDQLNENGVSQIDDLNICTLEDERFFSHRRTGAQSGRFLTLAALTDVI